MLKNLIQGLNKIKVASTVTPSSSIINKTNTPFLQQFLNTQPQIQLPTFEESNDLECVMNKTSRKALKKHRRKLTGKKSNMRRN
ncbi:hypothetical protein RB653_007261 [Dictyostelium firmibasis]|uniref:Uncharacterized protein n=1 Tax=Dictyostelium firmibasis TaxID=79012 RepID=A0AAN7YNV4_9MYCE